MPLCVVDAKKQQGCCVESLQSLDLINNVIRLHKHFNCQRPRMSPRWDSTLVYSSKQLAFDSRWRPRPNKSLQNLYQIALTTFDKFSTGMHELLMHFASLHSLYASCCLGSVLFCASKLQPVIIRFYRLLYVRARIDKKCVPDRVSHRNIQNFMQLESNYCS